MLSTDLSALDLPGLRWRPVAFTPRFGRIYVDTTYYGV